MNIKKVIKYCLIVIIIFVLLIGSISTVLMYQIKENTSSKKDISKLVLLQEEMNSKIKNLMLATTTNELEKIKKEFIKKEEEFKINKNLFFKNDTEDLLDYFILDLYKEKDILQPLSVLLNNENEIESKFDILYQLQKDKITYQLLFDNLYEFEKVMRKKIEKSISKMNDIQLMKDFGYLQYYSKETLYQYKNLKYLNKWVQQIESIYSSHKMPLLLEYKKFAEKIGFYIVNINNITIKEKILQKDILKIIEKNQIINLNIEKNIEKLATIFIDKVCLNLLILLSITILLIIIFGMKVYKNIGLSVDEIEDKVEEGLLQINQLNKDILDTQKEVVFTMGAIGESRSKETGNHVKRVAEYSKLIALKYGLSEHDAEMLKQASPMHDIGKIAIPDAILNKPGRFDPEERKIMDTHVQIGFDMLNNSNRPLLKLAAIVAYQHHERWDGTGYPQGLKGEQIDINGRITAIADVFDALGSDRVYKKSWEEERILQLFREERGKHFDPNLVDIFFENLDEFLKIRDQFRDNE